MRSVARITVVVFRGGTNLCDFSLAGLDDEDGNLSFSGVAVILPPMCALVLREASVITREEVVEVDECDRC